jgi:hypothetical protein
MSWVVVAAYSSRAEVIARSISDKFTWDSALSQIAVAVAATDPDHAEALARSL